MEWTQKYITLLGGDKDAVTAWGVSAGAGSIIHHLVAEGGTLDPLFRRVILSSPGFGGFQDRSGGLEKTFKNFEALAGCKNQGLTCLRSLSEEDLIKASEEVNSGQREGSFAFGPAPDGKYIVKTAAQEFAEGEDKSFLSRPHRHVSLNRKLGRYWKDIDWILSSHVANEGVMFSDSSITTDASFDSYILSTYGNDSRIDALKERIQELYPPLSAPGSPYTTQIDRLSEYVGDSTFTCHNRRVAVNYPGKVYSVLYSIPPATHGSDQGAIFYSPSNPTYNSLDQEGIDARLGYQSYFASFAMTGNPNAHRIENSTIDWPITTGLDDPLLNPVLNLKELTGRSGLELINDSDQSKEKCEFWTHLQQELEIILNK